MDFGAWKTVVEFVSEAMSGKLTTWSRKILTAAAAE
jgi:hypothetical protein